MDDLHPLPANIDKLTVTLPIPEVYWLDSISRLRGALTQGIFCRTRERSGENSVYKLYNYSMTLLIPGAAGRPIKCHIQFGPTNNNRAFLRLEWTPSKASSNAASHIARKLSPYVPHIYTAWERASITRVDIAYDIPHLGINEIVAFTGSARTIVECHRDEGLLTSIYLGATKSKRRVLVYDKRYELRRHSNGAQIENALTRIEFRLRDLGLRGGFTNIIQDNLSYFSFAAVALMRTAHQSEHWQSFVLRCQQTDAQSALAAVNSREARASRRAILRRCALPFMDYRSISEQANSKLQQILAISRAPRIRRTRITDAEEIHPY